MPEKTLLKLGSHLSIGGGIHRALEHAVELGATAVQFFVKSNRQWHAHPLEEHEVELFKRTHSKYSYITCIAHAGYLINLASPVKTTRTVSQKALLQEVTRCAQLEVPYIVVHPGSRLTGPVTDALKYIADGIDSVIEKAPKSPKILLETMAGQGSTIGSTFEELGQIVDFAHHKKNIGFCLDTCHIFAAGYDIRTPTHYTAVMRQWETILGFKNLQAIHLNDSAKKLGSRVDRHEHIGSGNLGIESFELLMNDMRLWDIPKILETPKDTEFADDQKNIKKLIETLSSPHKKLLKETPLEIYL